jgi:hypothetical protein
MKPTSTQSSLFDDNTDPAATSAATSLARSLVDGDGAQAQTRWQREFGKLSASVTTLRRELEQAALLRDAYQAHVAKVFDPRWRELLDARREWVLAADRVLQGQTALPKGQRLSAKRRKHLAAFIVMQVDELLALTGQRDEELVTIHDRHSDITLQESLELEEAMTRSMLEDFVGPDIAKSEDANDIEALIRRAHEHAEAQSREAEERRRTSARGAKARAKREQAAKEVSQSVREVYRKLASALHPDRETEPAERERKTALMQRANQAYEQGDLLQLLSMQISLIESDQGALARADDKRLQLYCQALREQQQALQREIADIEAPLRDAMQLEPGLRMPGRAAVLARIERDAKLVKRDIEAAKKDMAALLNPQSCGAVVDGLPLVDFDEDELRMLEAVMADAMKPRGRRRRR